MIDLFLLILFIVIPVLLAMVLLLQKYRNKTIPWWLVTMLISSGVVSAVHWFAIDYYKRDWLFQYMLLPDTIQFLWGVWVYFFSLTVTQNTIFQYRKALHFIPAILFLVCIIYLFQFDNDTYRVMLWSGQLLPYFTVITFFAIIINIIYFISSYNRLKAYYHTTNTIFHYLLIITPVLLFAGWGLETARNFFGLPIPSLVNEKILWSGLCLLTQLIAVTKFNIFFSRRL